jgi:hypothetical protein
MTNWQEQGLNANKPKSCAQQAHMATFQTYPPKTQVGVALSGLK